MLLISRDGVSVAEISCKGFTLHLHLLVHFTSFYWIMFVITKDTLIFVKLQKKAREVRRGRRRVGAAEQSATVEVFGLMTCICLAQPFDLEGKQWTSPPPGRAMSLCTRKSGIRNIHTGTSRSLCLWQALQINSQERSRMHC
jgi:hypothetical protein